MIDFINAAAVVIALSAFGLSVVQARGVARDRRIAVRPQLTFRRNSGLKSFRLTLLNTGLGPAEIMSLSYSVNGEIQPFEKETDIAPMLKGCGVNGCKIETFVQMTPGDYLPAGGEMVLVELNDVEPFAGVDLYRTAYGRLNVHITYRSVYGDEFHSSAHVNRSSHEPLVKST